MPSIISFDQAIRDSARYSKRHLLLGNGFSIACCPDIFHYGSLFGEADFSEIPEAVQVFEILGTQDFEVAIRALQNASSVLPVYAPKMAAISGRMRRHSQALKELLVSTIAGNHPRVPGDIPDEKFWACRRFLYHFLGPENDGQVYTLNYDLLLYWTLMHDDPPTREEPLEIVRNDGFGNDEDDPDAEYVIWQGETSSHGQRVHYLHGALHLFDAESELKKYTWVRTHDPLVTQARNAINAGEFPLFVAEGESGQKKSKIRHHAYLHHCYKSFVANIAQKQPCFFIFGHSLSENDDHILMRIGRGKFPKLYVGIYGDQGSPENRRIIGRANHIASLRNPGSPLEVSLFDSSSANVWGPEPS